MNCSQSEPQINRNQRNCKNYDYTQCNQEQIEFVQIPGNFLPSLDEVMPYFITRQGCFALLATAMAAVSKKIPRLANTLDYSVFSSDWVYRIQKELQRTMVVFASLPECLKFFGCTWLVCRINFPQTQNWHPTFCQIHLSARGGRPESGESPHQKLS